MTLTFHAPPGWPEPPLGWSPPPGWEPDPSWPAPPPGWRLLRRPNRYAFRRSFAATGVLFAGAVMLVMNSPAAPRWGVAVGHLLWVVLLLPGLIVGMAAHFSRKRWGAGRYAVAVLLAELGSLLLNAMATASTTSAGG